MGDNRIEQNCYCGMKHIREVTALASDEDYTEFMSQEVTLGGGEIKTVREIICDGMDRDFPNWKEKPMYIPYGEDSVIDSNNYLVPGEVGEELYINYSKFIMLDNHYNLEDLLDELDSFLSIANAGDNEVQEEYTQICVNSIKDIQNQRQCRSANLKRVVDKIIQLAVEVSTESKNDLKAIPIRNTVFYKSGGKTKKPKRFELEIFKLAEMENLFCGRSEFSVGEMKDIEALKSEIQQLKKNIRLVMVGLNVLLGGIVETKPIIELLQKEKPEKELRDNIVNREKERQTVIEVLQMLKESRIFKDNHSTLIHSCKFNWLQKIDIKGLQKIKIDGDHDTAVIVPIGSYVLVIFVSKRMYGRYII